MRLETDTETLDLKFGYSNNDRLLGCLLIARYDRIYVKIYDAAYEQPKVATNA